MLDFVAHNPDGVTVWQILDFVYADDPDGGVTAHNIVWGAWVALHIDPN